MANKLQTSFVNHTILIRIEQCWFFQQSFFFLFYFCQLFFHFFHFLIFFFFSIFSIFSIQYSFSLYAYIFFTFYLLIFFFFQTIPTICHCFLNKRGKAQYYKADTKIISLFHWIQDLIDNFILQVKRQRVSEKIICASDCKD